MLQIEYDFPIYPVICVNSLNKVSKLKDRSDLKNHKDSRIRSSR